MTGLKVLSYLWLVFTFYQILNNAGINMEMTAFKFTLYKGKRRRHPENIRFFPGDFQRFYRRAPAWNCVYVSGYERVSSDLDSLRINNFRITYPALYAATAWKEAINFY